METLQFATNGVRLRKNASIKNDQSAIKQETEQGGRNHALSFARAGLEFDRSVYCT
jgi:hypothetical protein